MAELTTVDLSIGYSTKVLARDINLSFEAGKMICLLGQNGVGKSTLLRTLSNLQKAISGKVLIDDQNITEIDRKILSRQMGIITTDKIGVSNMTVRELVALGRFSYTNWLGKESSEDKTCIEEAISTCKIDYLQSAKLGEISDGQFQKAMVARVLAQDTDIVLMDEPTAHLDVVNRIEMFRLLTKIKNEMNKSILISTHELDLSIQYADELWLMNFNKPMVVGTPQELMKTNEIQKIFYHEDFQIDLSQIKFNTK